MGTITLCPGCKNDTGYDKLPNLLQVEEVRLHEQMGDDDIIQIKRKLNGLYLRY